MKLQSFTLFLVFFCLQSQIWSTFDSDVGETLTITVAVNVTNTAEVTPFLISPDGLITIQSKSTLSALTGYTFSSFTVSNPLVGMYNFGIRVKNTGILLPAVVLINTAGTSIVVGSSSPVTFLLRGTTNINSVTLSPGETTVLGASFHYLPLSKFP